MPSQAEQNVCLEAAAVPGGFWAADSRAAQIPREFSSVGAVRLSEPIGFVQTRSSKRDG